MFVERRWLASPLTGMGMSHPSVCIMSYFLVVKTEAWMDIAAEVAILRKYSKNNSFADRALFSTAYLDSCISFNEFRKSYYSSCSSVHNLSEKLEQLDLKKNSKSYRYWK